MDERLFDEEAERQDRRAMESLNKLDNYLNAENDYLNNLEEDDVKIEDLRKLIDQLEEMKREYEAPDESLELDENQGANQKGGKQKVLTRPGSKNPNYATVEEYDNTAKEIASSFISCFILCMVTALIGTGWFLYIINHI